MSACLIPLYLCMLNQAIAQLPDCNSVELKLKGFKAYPLEISGSGSSTFSRRDFYKIGLFTGKSALHYANRSIELDGTFLLFANPHIPYSSQLLSEKQTGYTCLFTEAFLQPYLRLESLQQSPLFKVGGTPVFLVDEEQETVLSGLFRKMVSEQDTDYAFKNELIANYISLIIHEALKMQPSDSFFAPNNASFRIASLFLELMERQFPIESPDCPLVLGTAHDYPERLSVHVNHLNRSVKEITGKSTTTHISERIIIEAKALLQHTNWSIAEIAYGLGFDYTTHFNNFFKRMTQATPKSFRV